VEYLIKLLMRIKSKLYTVLLFSSFFSVGRKTTIIPPLRFANLSKIQLGNNVTIHSNCWILVLSSDDKESTPKLIIKDYAAIGMNATISAAKRIVIEEHVFTARNVFISDHGHQYYNVNEPIGKQGIRDIAEVTIGAHTWIGQNAVILPGVTIGKHCVIGANSVVNRSIPDFSIAVGAPAKVVKKYNCSSKCWERVQPHE
jgi:acetyltransferase-like isoleucine patch superfamily enzyme